MVFKFLSLYIFAMVHPSYVTIMGDNEPTWLKEIGKLTHCVNLLHCLVPSTTKIIIVAFYLVPFYFYLSKIVNQCENEIDTKVS
jgi:hypothetical protein